MKTLIPLFMLLAHTIYCNDDKHRRSVVPEKVSKVCRTKETCSGCITAGRWCAWCTEMYFSNERCDYFHEIQKTCNGSIIFPEEKLCNIQNKEFSDGSSSEDIIQIKPQKISIELKPNVPFSFNIHYKQAEDQPLDLYVLLDMSVTMEDDKKKLEKLSDSLAERMGNITRKFRLGLGSFFEKIALPYFNTHPYWLNVTCQRSEGERCSSLYTYRNNMPLGTDISLFKEEIINITNLANFDYPEATLEALMQAIVCKKQLNWREDSRKLVVVATDEGYHYGGDGKIAGILRPNDEKCHLDPEGYYTADTQQDYPSVSQIRNAILKNSINVIFAVTKNQSSQYEALSRRLDGSIVGELENDSSNIVDLIQDNYSKITSSVKFYHNASRHVNVTLYSSCMSGVNRRTDECTDVFIGSKVTFEVQIEVISCPKNKDDWNQTFQIYPVGINEPVTVDLRIICECDCEKPWNKETASDYCSYGNGTYECGICSCYKNRSGKKCQCNTENGEVDDSSPCFRPNDTVACSGKGVCVCGHCECFRHENTEHKTKGQYCECDNFSCDRYNQLLCGGPDRGICECGECKCLPGWEGSVCECPLSNETCTKDMEVCSGHGICECGVCVCKQTEEERYSGEFCEQCLVCTESCELHKDCSQCKAFRSGPLSENCESCHGNYEIVKELNLSESRNECYVEDEEGCVFVFTYDIKENGSLVIKIKEDRDCPTPVNAIAISLGVIGGIVIVGILALLAWKLFTNFRDSREYFQFVQEQRNTKWKTDVNPLYKGATSTFSNPSFGKEE